MDSSAAPSNRRRWVVLVVGFVAMTTACSAQYGLPFLIPALREDGLTLSQAGLVVAAPVAGLLLTLVAWGAAADRWGERVILGSGLALSGTALTGAVFAQDYRTIGVALVLAGVGSASVHAASGRLVLGWFAEHERGLAMAVRQTSQPIGIAVAALTLPSLATRGLAPAFGFLAALSLFAAVLVAVAVTDPAREAAGTSALTGSPYRSGTLWRIHAVSALLVVPQFGIATFGLTHLVDEQGWNAAAAGRALAIAAVGGAAARLAAGYWSDRVRSRLRPLRLVTLAIGTILLAVAASSAAGPGLAALAVLTAAVVTVSPNGLAFTAVAEHAGHSWAGRAMGIQNTVQNAFAAAVPPVLGSMIVAVGYSTTFAVAALFPFAAIALIPLAAERGGAERTPGKRARRLARRRG